MRELTDADDVSGDSADVVRSEEELVVRRRRIPLAKVRVRKVIVTDEITLTVAVRREELHVEHDEVADGEGLVEPEAVDRDVVMLLSEEVPAVTLRTVPYERVHVSKHVITEYRDIDDTLRKERVEVDEPTSNRR